MEPSLRRARLSEACSLSCLAVETYVAAFGHSMPPEDLREHGRNELSEAALTRILRTDVVLVAERCGELVAFAQFGHAHEKSEPRVDAELRRLYVLGQYQNRGIGSRLMRAALEHPLLASARSIALDVWSQNLAAQRFYRRHGFHPVGTRPFSVASGAETSPDIIMTRVVSDIDCSREAVVPSR
jgi:ribosomal protein S18 acetylase RimI-like enzyme